MEDLTKLKTGDIVLFQNGNRYDLIQVTRTTSTQIICNNYMRFRKKDGHMVGSSCLNANKIKIASPEIIKEFEQNKRQKKFINELTQFAQLLHTLSLESLERIHAAFCAEMPNN
jgi:fibrillarin-like rRNA methylase